MTSRVAVFGRFLAPLLFAISSLCPILHAQGRATAEPAGASLRIQVRDPSGAALSAAGRLEGLGSSFRRPFQTDASGLATLTGLPLGRFRLQVNRTGFSPTSSVIEFTASGQSLTESVVLSVSAETYEVEVISATPLPGVGMERTQIAAPVQVAQSDDLQRSGALDLSSFLNQRLNGVYLNEVQGNPVQPDVNYRGYTASPLLGTPQGLSIYMDGVRLNQSFGDVVSWDLIPRIAISEVALMPGSNPLFGLNTLGGALSISTKEGQGAPTTTLSLSGGSFGRKVVELEHGGSTSKGFSWYGASNLFFEDGWRQTSPSNVRQFFGKVGKQGDKTAIWTTVSYANNQLNGNGLQEQSFLARDYSSVYTKPDITGNRSPFLNIRGRHTVSPNVLFTGNAYYRYIRTRSFNGDINEDSLDQSIYQPGAAERAALAAAGYTGVPASGATAANTPFPSWRCIGNALILDEPAEKCNGLLNRGRTQQHNYGLSGQMTWFSPVGSHRNQFTAGAALDRNHALFTQSSQLGYLNPDRSVTPVEAYGDGVNGGDEDGEPYDTRVDLRGNTQTGSIYATDTLTAGQWNLTISGRFNHTSIDNHDLVRPTAGTGSLTGTHSFDRFNPSFGMTRNLRGGLNVYASYSEGNRAPASVELGCADPEAPCKLPNSMAGDPPLKQVVSRTVEAGIRGSGEGQFQWSAGWFFGQNSNDILFVASEQTGFGYFKNFGKTRRQGLELSFNGHVSRLSYGANYTLLDATFQSQEEVNGTGNSTNEAAEDGEPGLESSITIHPGNRIPLIPRNMFKTYADVQATSKLSVSLTVLALSGAYARGNENNEHHPDGTYYLGEGRSPGYAVVNLGARYQVHRRAELFLQINNLLDRKYYTAAQLGPTGFTDTGNFIARPLPAINGEFPVRQSTFLAPGAPVGAWGGIRVRF